MDAALLYPRCRGKPSKDFNVFSLNPTEQEHSNRFLKSQPNNREQCTRTHKEDALDAVGGSGGNRKIGMLLFKTEQRKSFTRRQLNNRKKMSSPELHVNACKPFREKEMKYLPQGDCWDKNSPVFYAWICVQQHWKHRNTETLLFWSFVI